MKDFLKGLVLVSHPLLVGLSLAVLVGLGIFMLAGKSEQTVQSNTSVSEYWRLSEQLSRTENSETPFLDVTPQNIDQNTRPVFTEFTPDDISKGQVVWQEPENLGDLGWTDKDVFSGTYSGDDGSSQGVKYLKVGKVISGKYVDSDIILVASHIIYDGPYSNAPSLAYYLRRGKEVVFLPHADTRNGAEKNLMMSEPSLADRENRSKLGIYPPNKSLDAETRIIELASYPEEFSGRTDREVFVRNTYAGAAFFTDERLKRAFTHPTLGEVWMADSASKKESKYELNSFLGKKTIVGKTSTSIRVKQYYDPVVVGGFYVKRPDGIMESYRLKFDIFDQFNREGILQATWNDGTQNTQSYEEYPSGCGLSAYVYDETGTVNLKKELVKIGEALQGDALYGYKDTTSKGFKDLYRYFQDGYALFQDKSLTEEQFLAMRPVVFWVDPFGRLLKFQNAQFVPLAECGKPVVYLYPEQTSTISVQVFPDEGVSVSDPEYYDGWMVTATPDGTLTNHADNREYPYLFWEGGSTVLYQPSDQGFVVAQDGLSGFFNEKLSELGLIGREISDFKEFWIPKMQESNKPYYFISFLPRKQIDEMAPLRIEPKPDTLIRVMMDYEGLDTYKEVTGYKLRTPERRGFTAVEWGGRLKK